MHRPISRYCLTTLLTVVALAACTRDTPEPAWQDISIAVSSGYPGSCPVFAAEAMKRFDAHRVKVRLIQRATGLQAMNTVISGDADLATVADVPFALAVMQGKTLSIVASIAKFRGDTALVVNAGSDTDLAASLRGKRVGVSERTAGHYALSTILARHNLLEQDVQVTNLNPQAMGDAFLSGKVNAVATWEPFRGRLVSAAQASGMKDIRVIETGGMYVGNWLIAGDTVRMQQKGEAIRAVLKGLADGVQQCNSNPESAFRTLAASGSMTEAEARSAWPVFKFAITLDQGLILSLEDQAEWGRRQGLVQPGSMPNFLKHIDTAPLRAVSPHSITIIE
jgi:NitT/TauT family transport system substrate-binding protein